MKVVKIVKTENLTKSRSRESMWRSIHLLSLNNTENLEEFVLKMTDAIDLNLTDEEQQIVRYVGGYILFALVKKYQKLNEKPNTICTAALRLLSSFQVSPGKLQATSLDFTKKMDRIN